MLLDARNTRVGHIIYTHAKYTHYVHMQGQM